MELTDHHHRKGRGRRARVFQRPASSHLPNLMPFSRQIILFRADASRRAACFDTTHLSSPSTSLDPPPFPDRPWLYPNRRAFYDHSRRLRTALLHVQQTLHRTNPSTQGRHSPSQIPIPTIRLLSKPAARSRKPYRPPRNSR